MSNRHHSVNSKTSILQQIQWKPSDNQLRQLTKLQSCLEEWNKKINLTRLLRGDDYWINQVLDSLWPFESELKFPNKYFKCIDIGSGCGFPGMALAIAMPEIEMTLVDSASKKTTALEDIAKQIGLSSRLKVRNERVEITGQNQLFRQKFDIGLARAVAEANIVAEYIVPLLKPKGEALIYKGHWKIKEQKLLQKALISLNSKINNTQKYSLPNYRGERHAIRVSGSKECPPRYPRQIGTPCKYPLGT